MNAIHAVLRKACIAFALAAFSVASVMADDKPTMVKCTAAQKQGDQCASGICVSGKQTIYTCAADKTCTKSDKKQDCSGSKSKATLASKETTAIASDKSAGTGAYQGVYKVINNGGPGCAAKLTEEASTLYDKYGAWHYCFTYKFAKNHDFFSDVTNIVWDGFNIILPFTNYVELHQPARTWLRFKVANGKDYRLYRNWTHHISNIPPPGRYTDHRFINVKERQVDYLWMVKQRGAWKNARISGVAEVVFLPDELFEQAKKDGFLGCPDSPGCK
jgi:hypothetical protein